MASPVVDDAILAQIPAIAAPAGMQSNLVNPSNDLFVVSVATYIICIFLVVMSVSIRSFTKAYLMRSMQVEDYASIFATMGGIAGFGLSITALTAGSGSHEWDLSVLRVSHLNKLLNFAVILYFPIIFLAKFSVLWPMVRLFAPHKTGPIYWCTLILTLVNLFFYLASLCAWVLQCIPLRKTWDFFSQGTCYINPNALFVAGAAFNIMSDLLMLVLPLYSIWHLKMAIKRKVGVSAIFATALFALVASIARLIFAVQILSFYDISHTYHQASLWTFAELTTILIVGCMPTMPRFVQYLAGKTPAKAVYQYYKDTPVLRSIRKKSFTTTSSSMDTVSHEPMVAHTYRPLPGHPIPQEAHISAPPRKACPVREYVWNEDALEHEDSGQSGNITKTVHIETSEEARAQSRDGKPKRGPAYWV